MSGLTRKAGAIQRPNRTILSRTLFLLAVCGVAAFGVLAVKLYQLQIKQHDYYESLAVEQQTRQADITASRGTIYDTNGKALAVSASVETVFISPGEIVMYGDDAELIASGLSEILGVNEQTILDKAKKTGSYYERIKRKIETEEATLVREFIKEHKLKSVHLEADSKRYYPRSSLACQVIGFVGDDNNGLDGVELKFDSYLTGVNGRVVRLKTERGADMLFNDFEDYHDAEDGSSITLTIDSNIQYYVEKALAQALEDYDVKNGGSCLAFNPKTGEVLAMASYANYDLNNFLEVSDEVKEQLALIEDEEEYNAKLREAQFTQWRNKSLADTYEPGSVFKTITLAIALEEGLISESDTFHCSGHMEVPGRKTLNCWRTQGHNTQTLAEAVQNSCNVAFANIGMRIGAETFYKYAEAFGLFDKTGFDLPGEASSIWWSKQDFLASAAENQLSSLVAASFGQTFKITPLQMITAFSASINGGYLMEPYVVKSITDSSGNVVYDKQPTAVRQVISEETSAFVRETLESVVSLGTGRNAGVVGFRIGGKTGTSEFITAESAEKAESGSKDYIVSFCGFAPADDPQIVVLLLLDTPKSTSVYISGGAMAAPVVGRMMEDILPYLGVTPQYTDEQMQALDVQTPKMVGKSIEEAKSDIKGVGLEYKVVGEGDTVTYQLPAANAMVSPGTKVILYAGAEPPEEEVTVPNLSNLSYSEAKKKLEEAGLFIKTYGALKSERGVAVSVQSLPAGTKAAFGTVIEVTLIDTSSVFAH